MFPRFIDKEKTSAGDICLVKNESLEKYFIRADDYSLSALPSSIYTPIGIVVVPFTHTDNGTVRLVSLVSMDPNNPDNGNESTNVSIYWGGYGVHIEGMKRCVDTPYIASGETPDFGSEEQIIGWLDNTTWGRFSSDYFQNGPQNPYDPTTFYGISKSTNYWCSSPYKADGTINHLYRIEHIRDGLYSNRSEEMDGRPLTDMILSIDNSNSTEWTSAATISNVSDDIYTHPAAQCCWRYHTIGTEQGDWYLPSGGELGYLGSRFQRVLDAIERIKQNGFPAYLIDDDIAEHRIWSSSMGTNNSSVHLCVSNKNVVEGTWCDLSVIGRDLARLVRAYLSV